MVDEDVENVATETETAEIVTEPVTPEAPVLPTVTSAAQWRKMAKARWLITLPSSVIVKAQRPDWQRLILERILKAEEMLSLRQQVMEPEELEKLPESEQQRLAREHYERIVDIGRRAVPHIVIEPTVMLANGHAPEPDAEYISVDQIPNADIIAVLFWSTGMRELPMREVLD